MARIRNLNAPAADPFGHTWDTPDQVVDVPDEHAVELLRLPHGGWREVLPEDEAAAEGELVLADQLVDCPTCAGDGRVPAHVANGPVPLGGSVMRAPGSLAGMLTGQPDMRAAAAALVTVDGGAPGIAGAGPTVPVGAAPAALTGAATMGEADADNQINNGLGHLTPDGTVPVTGAGPIPGDATGYGDDAVSPEVVAGEMTERVELDPHTGEPVEDGEGDQGDDPEADRNAADADEAEREPAEPYDPDGHKDAEVLDYLRGDDVDEDEVNRVLDAAGGPSGKARPRLLKHREELLQAKRHRGAPVTE